MQSLRSCSFLLAAALAWTPIGCSTSSTKSADVFTSIRTALDQSGLKEVTVSQDRDKGVVTLGGRVAADSDKLQAETIAKSIAGSQVVSNQIAVIPPDNERDARKVNSELDKGIENNLNASLITEKLNRDVKFSVTNHVVTLTGEVDSPWKRARAEEAALAVVNVKQVVNELQVKKQKATSSN
jgi:hyperosmotically inducible periplasmic protein